MQLRKETLIAAALAAVLVAGGFLGGRALATTVFDGGWRQILAAQAVPGHSCVTTDDYWSTPGTYGVTWAIDSAVTATVGLYRVDRSGTEHYQCPSTSPPCTNPTITANFESTQQFQYPLGRSRLKICNTTGSSGVIGPIEANEMGGRSR